MISAIFITTQAGDILIAHSYRNDIPSNYKDLFMVLRISAKDEFLPPENESSNTWFYQIKRNSLYFVAVSKKKQSEFAVIEMLSRLFLLCKDFCGAVNEDMLRCNFVLIQEILLEFIDYGYVQLSSASKLKSYVYSPPVMPKCTRGKMQHGLFGLENPELSSQAANQPIVRSRVSGDAYRNEIFLDVIEYLSVVINKEGTVIRSEVGGQLTMKSFIMGNPDIKLGLNEDLSIGSVNATSAAFGSSVYLDNCSFHSENVNLELFAKNRVLMVHPVQGEFDLMTYRIHSNPLAFLPFRLIYDISKDSNSRDVDITLTLRCQVPGTAKALKVLGHLSVPKSTTSVMSQLGGPAQSSTNFDATLHKIMWNIQNFVGGTESVAKLKLVGSNMAHSHLLELGPLVLEFELSAFVCSGLGVRFLQVCDSDRDQQMSSAGPSRWVRYVTHSDSYIFKLA